LAHKTRFGAEITSRPESISEHSYWVALFAKAIARHYVEPTGLKVNEGHVLDIALNHDIPEILTTDVPNPIKKASRAVERFYNRQEKLATIELAKCLGFSDFSGLVQEFNEGKTIEAQIVKMADKLSGLIWCVEELACGNRNIVIAFRGYYNELVAQGNVEDIPDWRKKLISDVTGFVEHHFSLQILKDEIVGDK
jgi:5'-deoxynucleotidase YfbR-like HD superfamily hydrolase